MSEKKLFLLDAFALIYRAHFAFIKNPRMSSKGVNTSAIFGFTNSLLEILRKERPTHLGVAFDTKAPTFRHIEFPEYKAQRDEMPEDIITAIPLTKKLLNALNIPILELDGFEADDIIGTLAKRAEGHGYKVYMVTPDKDYAQLVTDSIFLYKPARNGNEIDILNPAKVKESMGIAPEHVADFLGLKGDAVDNIPGIPKVGDKTAIELINEFGSVEEIVKNAESISKKSIRETVLANGDKGILSKRLATIITDAPIPWNEETLKVGDPDKEAFLNIMLELEFRSTAERILKSSIFGGEDEVQRDLFGNSTEQFVAVQDNTAREEILVDLQSSTNTLQSHPHEYVLISNDEALEKLISLIETSGTFCFDTETTSLDPMSAELVAITISVKPGEAFMIHFTDENKSWSNSALEKLKPLFESEKIEKSGQNLKYDMLMLRNCGVEVKGPLFDTMLAHYLIDADKPHGMDALANEYLNYSPISITELIGKKGKNQITMKDVPVNQLLDYACEDADITLSLRQSLEPLLTKTEVRNIFDDVEMPLVPVLTEMEFIGVKIDEKALNDYSKELEKEMANIERDIYKAAGLKFNINSPKQLGGIIFEKLNLAKGKKTKTGQYSTREEILSELAIEHDFPAFVLRYRKLGKLKSTYVDSLPLLINKKTGRVHTTFSQAVAATGRLSSNNPNMQNIPIRSDEGREIRKTFIPEKGFLILSADYSQVELRIMAHLSEDEAMIEDFIAGHDIHRATASRVFGVSLDEVSDDMRSKAKMVNFGIIYGISAFGLAQRLRISRTEAAEIIEAYFSKYRGVKSFMDASINFARDNGFAKTIIGRRRYLPDINSKNQTIRGFAERNAINAPVQGSAADLIKLAMIHVQAEMKAKKMKSRMILQVHDELVFEAAENEVEGLKSVVVRVMASAMDLRVPMLAEAGTGSNWLEAH